MEFLLKTQLGLFCPQGDFYIDPVGKVNKALITHGHSDHARFGADHYLCHKHTALILKKRLGKSIQLTGVNYSEPININGVRVSFHPAGHVLGSAQIRMEYKGQIWVVTGDYKLADDPTCEPFEFLKSHHLLTESTFALPIYKWQSNQFIFSAINQWWQKNAMNLQPSLIGAYSLGKAQRIMASLDATIGPIYVHGAIHNLMDCYEAAGVCFPNYSTIDLRKKDVDYSRALIIAPPSSIDSSWSMRFKNKATAFASGWVAVRGNKRRRNIATGFVLSDHADWPSLLKVIKHSEAEDVIVTHGYSKILCTYLNELGFHARQLHATIY